MKLSAPIHVLKTQAKKLKNEQAIALNEALNIIANREGYNSWSLLQSKADEIFPQTYPDILDFFNAGDLVLIGARPAMGKTSFTMGLLVQAIQKKGAKHFCFSLSEIHRDIAGRMKVYDQSIEQLKNFFELDYSDEISADYIIKKISSQVSEGSVIVIDYLQLLDQKRSKPELQTQVEQLKLFAKEKYCIVIFISQVDRKIENQMEQRPHEENINLPNKIDLSFFNKILFLFKESEDEEVEVIFRRPKDYSFKIVWDKKSYKFT